MAENKSKRPIISWTEEYEDADGARVIECRGVTEDGRTIVAGYTLPDIGMKRREAEEAVLLGVKTYNAQPR